MTQATLYLKSSPNKKKIDSKKNVEGTSVEKICKNFTEQQQSHFEAEMTICAFAKHVISVPVYIITVSLMRLRQPLLFTLSHTKFYCTLSASLSREIDSSVISGTEKESRQEWRRGGNAR